MFDTLLKLLKNLGILIAIGFYIKIADFILEFCSNPVSRLIFIVLLFIFIPIILCLCFIHSRKAAVKRRKTRQYAKILKNEIEKLNNTKKEIDKQYTEYLKNKLFELKEDRCKLNHKSFEYLNNSVYDIHKNKYCYDKQYIKQVFTDEYINKAIDFPDGLIYQNNKIIDIYSNEKYGRFTAYAAPNGKVIHFKRGCSQATIPVDITKFIHVQYSYIPQGFNPSIEDYKIAWDFQAQYYVCKKCKHRNKMKFFYMPEWYKQYLKIQKLKERYNIE